MQGEAPVAVIGAGVVGTACARALQRAGRRVLLVDPSPPGSLCSAGNAGHIAIEQVQPLARPEMIAAVPRMLAHPQGPLTLRWRGLPAMLPWFLRMAAASRPGRVEAGTLALAALLRDAVADWRDLLDTPDLAALLRYEGAIAVTESEAGRRAAEAEAAIMAAHGVRLESLGPAEVAARIPGLSAPVTGGQFFPEAAHAVEPQRLVRDLAARFAAEGGEILAQPVTGLRREGGRIAAVETPGGERAAESVILAAGLASARLAPMLGLRLPLTAERGYHAMLPPGSVPLPCPVAFAERGFIATPIEHGTRLAGTVELGAAGRAPDWSRAEILVRHARDLFGPVPEAASRWQGDRPTLPDYLPALGPVPGLANAVVATGHQHLGLTLAATTARLVSALVTSGTPGLDLTPFDPARFGRH
ncbi:D-amino-acid dehydrogenase [Roseomonas rosea]|uniref:D-amino-acid dehydrogenase n=1 Tax=Muricoccus roseus TaxID=198092 RepID=A0A1M6H6X1_9PROT|nr:FAD-binding oxidoreductase [Roseomonas rosea]SHJ17863.1 D-amino-acid dehydrogenase [Roseomonas rosea]